jgi:signal peptidase II
MAAPERSAPVRRALAGGSPAAWAVLIGVMALGLAIDLGSKSWAFAAVAPQPVVLDRETILSSRDRNPVPPHPSIPVLPGNLLDLHLVTNHGAVFGIGADKRVFFIVFTLVALVGALYVFARRTAARHHLAHVALALIMAGGFGNLYDRIVFGVVRDFLHMLPGWRLPFGWRWPGGSPELFPWVFNVADVMLLVGMGLLIIHINALEKRRKLAANNAAAISPAQAPTTPPSSTAHPGATSAE